MSLRARVEVRSGPFELAAELVVEPGEVVALVGPNGAGKSTLLRCLAGLTPLDAGQIVLDDRTLEDVANSVRLAPEERNVGVVFQDQLLFPHLNAAENIAFGLRARGLRRREARERAAKWLDRMSLTELGNRRPEQLSGGQAGQIALARALATKPGLLLLDEPLAAMDVATRLSIRRVLREHLEAFNGPCVLVTHEPVDAIALADRLAVIENGRIVQTGAVAEVARRPRSAWAARLVGLNLYRGTARAGTVTMANASTLAAASPVAGDVFAVVHPRSVALHNTQPSGSPRNVWCGQVDGIDAHRDHVRVHVGGALPIVAEITPAAAGDLRLGDTDGIWVSVKASEVDLYPA